MDTSDNLPHHRDHVEDLRFATVLANAVATAAMEHSISFEEYSTVLYTVAVGYLDRVVLGLGCGVHQVSVSSSIAGDPRRAVATAVDGTFTTTRDPLIRLMSGGRALNVSFGLQARTIRDDTATTMRAWTVFNGLFVPLAAHQLAALHLTSLGDADAPASPATFADAFDLDL
ncbi:hypothetical protein [Streptomyces sp. NPDC051572]|uniref:hypothetical protein n=1 Tax=Streptomyces sp. NPDC051572 TaxID=3155802 RepID=UPI00344BDF47